MKTTIDLRLDELAAKHPEGSLERGIAALLGDMCVRSAAAADIIGDELHDDVLQKLATEFTAYARTHKSGSYYGMTPQTAEKLVRDHFKIPDQTDESKRRSESVNVLDLLL